MFMSMDRKKRKNDVTASTRRGSGRGGSSRVVVGVVVVVGVGAGIAVDGGMANTGPWIGSRGTVPRPAPLPSRYTGRV